MSDSPIDYEKMHRQQVFGLYRARLSHLKSAQAHVKAEKFNMAVEEYNKYLGIMLMYFNITEDQFSPKLFDKDKDLTELFLISHAYWDLAKIYDMTHNRLNESVRCLNMFVRFTQGFKYQHANAQIVRKYLLKNKAYNKKAFEETYTKLQVQSKKCYVATMCFGEHDEKTNTLRAFKYKIARKKFGLDFIDWYYSFSPELVHFLEEHSFLQKIFNLIMRPTLSLFVKAVKKYVYN